MERRDIAYWSKIVWHNLVYFMNKPENGASLAVFRILFYSLMVLDIPYERSFAYVDYVFGEKADLCRFPLFDALSRPSVLTVSLIYIVMLTGAFGSLIGLFYRLSTLMFALPYWFIFIQDKTSWNNHSYLYGLIGTMFIFFDAHSIWSIDSYLNKNKHKRVPQWNYFLLKSQIFLVYFLAGLKKTEADWLDGYSCSDIADHWVFTAFRYFLSNEMISWCIVHICGFVIDLFVGFLLLFNKTRLFATIIVSSFHCMNSQIFSIGMFPFVMLASTIIFYRNDWPILIRDRFFGKIIDVEASINHNCIYDKNKFKNEVESESVEYTKMKLRHKLAAALTILYFMVQLFLPYSHFITQGYNSWTNGLYGYSWDMMVHSWHTQHIKITCVNLKTNKTIYIKPNTYTSTSRWSSHADMIKQHAVCISKQLSSVKLQKKETKQKYAVYMDIWRSMNHRFEQRQVRPDVDLAAAAWHPLKPSEWIIPLYKNLSDWRPKMKSIRESFEKKDKTVQLTFVADAPGLRLTNYIEPDISAVLTVLDGEVIIEDPRLSISTRLNAKSLPYPLKSGDFHNVYIASSYPACYYYAYRNKSLNNLLKIHERLVNYSLNILSDTGDTDKQSSWNILLERIRELNLTVYAEEHDLKSLKGIDKRANLDDEATNEIIEMLNDTIYSIIQKDTDNFQDQFKRFLQRIKMFITGKFMIYKRSFYVVAYTFECIVNRKSLEQTLFDKYDRYT